MSASKPATPSARLLGDIALGVYLVHPLVIALLLRMRPIPGDSLAFAFLVTVISTGGMLALRRSPLGALV